MNPLVWPAIIEIGFITWRSMSGEHFAVSTKGASGASLAKGQGSTIVKINDGVRRPPLPSELLAVMLVFGVFGIIAERNARIGSLLGWGIVLATGLLMTSNVPPAAAPAPASKSTTTA